MRKIFPVDYLEQVTVKYIKIVQKTENCLKHVQFTGMYTYKVSFRDIKNKVREKILYTVERKS